MTPWPRHLVASPALSPLLAALVLLGGGCGDRPSTSRGEAAPAASAVSAPITGNYPVRHLFVEARATHRSPTKGPRTREEARSLAEAVVRRLRAPGADFAAIATEVSDDPVTAAAEGFGGFLTHWNGDEKAVVDAAFALAVGAVSDPIESPRGYHVVQRLSREEGKALEARVVVPMEGAIFQWKDADPARAPDRTKAEAYADAAAFARRVADGADPVAVVNESLDRLRTFALPMRRHGLEGWEAFIEAAFQSEVGTWIGPIETKDGWVVSRRQPYVRAEVRHLVVCHRQSPGESRRDRLPEEALYLAQVALERLKADPGAWDKVVAEVSDEPGSRVLGGYTGDFTTVAEPARRMAPEIAQVVLDLEPGARSGVEETRFGFHVFWRVD